MLKKTTVWLLSVMMLMMMLVAGCGGGEEKQAAGNDSQKLIVYTSMKESLIKGIVDGFKKANPGIDVDYQSAGAGKLMAKIAAERQSGKILADVIWTSEVPDFYNMKNEGILLNYKSPVEPETVNPFDDYDGSFHAARLGTLGIVINTDKIKTAPTQWSDLMGPDYNGNSLKTLKLTAAVSVKAPARLSTILLPANLAQHWQLTTLPMLKLKKALTCSFAIRPNCS